MLQGNILAWQLAEAGATATPDAITDTGAGFLEVTPPCSPSKPPALITCQAAA